MLFKTRHLLTFAAIVLWTSTAAAVPTFTVSASSNPIVGGIVQLHPGDMNVSITFTITPDADKVSQYNAFLTTGTSSITTDSCASPTPGTTAGCTPGTGTDFDFQGDFGNSPLSAPFTAGTVVLSLANPIIGQTVNVRTDKNSFIADENFVETSIRGQVVGIVVPEPSTAVLTGLGLMLLAVRARKR